MTTVPTTTAGSTSADGAPAAGRAGGWALGLAMFVVVFEGAALNLTLPGIARDLHAGPAGLEWVANGYVLPLASLLLLAGTAGDTYGRRRLLGLSLVGFALCTGLCALSPDVRTLVGLRVLQGVCGAGIMPMVLALAVHSSPDPTQRARVVNRVAVSGSLGLVAGPFVGGALTELAGWRWVFLVVVPVAIAAASQVHHLPEAAVPDRHPVGVAGLALAVAGPLLVVGGLVELSERGLHSRLVGCLLGGGAVALAAFAAHQRLSSGRLVPPWLAGDRVFRACLVSGFGLQFTAFGLQLMFALYLQAQWALSPVLAAVTLLPFSAATIVTTAVVNPALVGRGIPFMLATGMVTTVLGALALTGTSGPSTWPVLVVGQALVGIGTSLYSPSLNQLASARGGGRSGLASGLYATGRQVGMATAVAALGALALGPHPVAGIRIGAALAAGTVLLGLLLLVRASRRSGRGRREDRRPEEDADRDEPPPGEPAASPAAT